MTTALEVRNLCVTFGRDRVLRNLSFTVDAGKTLAMIGPNGAGKTVLFRALIGALPYEGEVVWAPGTRIGYVPQKLDIERDLPLTGLDFLRAKASVARAPREEIARVLADTGLSQEAAARPLGALSGGQFQRLLLAFALIGGPNALILDEPTAGVDEPGQERLNALVHRLQAERGLAVLTISHDLSVVYRYAGQVLCLGEDHACLGAPQVVLTPERLEKLYGAPAGFHVHGRG